MNNTTPDVPGVCFWTPAGNVLPHCKTAESQKQCCHCLQAFILVKGPECCQMKMNAVTSKFNICVYSKQFFQCWLEHGSICLWLVTPPYFVQELCNLKENLIWEQALISSLPRYIVFLILLIPWFPQRWEHEAVFVETFL